MRRIYVWLLFILMVPSIAVGERYALIVGINDYPNFPLDRQLEGCVNDARWIKKVLIEQFGFPDSNIKVLLNHEATKGAIIQAIEEHLIKRSKPGDVLVFYYSGHGSLIHDQSGAEPSGKSEVLCPADVGVAPNGKPPVNVIMDSELGKLVGRLEQREVVTIFDCCYSGIATRDLLSFGRSRYLPLEGDQQPVEPEAPLQTRGLPPLGSSPVSRNLYDHMNRNDRTEAVQFAACREDETAHECDLQVQGRQERHGVMTVKLIKAFQGEAEGSAARLTYRSLKQFLENPLITENHEQHPQVNCRVSFLDRDIFHVYEIPSPAPIVSPALSPAPGENPIPPSTPAAPPAPLLTMQETSPPTIPTPLMPSDSGSQMVGVESLKVHLTPYSAFFAKSADQDSGIGDRLRAFLARRPFIKLVRRREESDVTVFYNAEKPSGGARFVVGTILLGGGISSCVTADTWGDHELKPLLDELKRLWLVNNLLRMRNPASGFGVRIELSGGGDVLRLGQAIAFRVRAKMSGYLTLINVDCRGGVHQLLPNDYKDRMRIKAGEELAIPSGEFELAVEKPVGREFIKAFVTTRPLKIPAVARARSLDGIRSIDGAPESEELLDELYRAVGVRPKISPTGGSTPNTPGAGTMLEQLGREDWGEDSFIFYTGE